MLAALLPPAAVGVGESSSYDGAADVNWLLSHSARATGYRVLRSFDGGPFGFIGEARQTTYTDIALQPGHTYCYQVEAYDGYGERSRAAESACLSVARPVIYVPIMLRQ